ncbi:MAG: hypothetical protein WC974_06445 [Thermoplasmata archaeon]
MNCQQILLYEQTEKPKIFIPCPTEHPTIAHPTETDYRGAMFNEILFDYFSEYKNKITINPIFNDIINQSQIEAQFNPYSVENIPPRIENVNIHYTHLKVGALPNLWNSSDIDKNSIRSYKIPPMNFVDFTYEAVVPVKFVNSDVKYSWEEIHVSMDVVSSIWSLFNWIVKTITQVVTQKVEIVEHCWAVVSCDVYDVSKISYVQIRVIDTDKSKTFYPQATQAHLF